MYRKMLILVLTVALLTMMPVVVLAGPTNDRNGNSGTIRDAEDSQQQNAENQAQFQNNLGIENGEASLERLMQTTRERLQTMEKDRLQTREGWQEMKDNLAQLKQQYSLQTRAETKEEIKSMFRAAIQLKKGQGQVEETESLLRDLISLDSKDQEAYRELGTIFRNRGETDPKVFLNGNEIKPDVPPVVKEGRTLVPVRALTEALGAAVQWNEKEQTVLVSKGDTKIQLRVNNMIALVNGNEFNIDIPAEINSSRIFVPLRFIMQVMNAGIEWYPEGQIIALNQ